MAGKRYKPEEIVAKLRQADVLVSQGQSVVDAVRSKFVISKVLVSWGKSAGVQLPTSILLSRIIAA